MLSPLTVAPVIDPDDTVTTPTAPDPLPVKVVKFTVLYVASSYPDPAFVIDIVSAACARCANFSATIPLAVEFDVCVITDPISIPLDATEDVRPTVTLLENVSIGFSANLFLESLMFRDGL